MKKYQAPVTRVLSMDLLSFVCGSGGRGADWGNNDPDNSYSNGEWHNQGYGSSDQDIEDDEGTLDATSKGLNDLWN